MKKLQLLFLNLSLSFAVFSQGGSIADRLPYYQIPAYPDTYTAGTVAARMIDGLGFRFHWATDGLRAEDLVYRPTDGARNLEETVDHIYTLVMIIRNTVEKEPYSGVSLEALSFEEKRRQILENLYFSSEALKQQAGDFETSNIVFKRGEQSQQYPFWNLLNGPLADAINHVGQVITFRRTAGNPINPKISVLTGTVLE